MRLELRIAFTVLLGARNAITSIVGRVRTTIVLLSYYCHRCEHRYCCSTAVLLLNRYVCELGPGSRVCAVKCLLSHSLEFVCDLSVNFKSATNVKSGLSQVVPTTACYYSSVTYVRRFPCTESRTIESQSCSRPWMWRLRWM